MSEIEILSLPEIPCRDSFYSDWNTDSFNYIYNAEDLSYEEFFNEHLLKNLPCVVKNITTDWESTTKWIKDSGDIDYEYIRRNFGDMEAPVANCNTLEFNSHCKSDMKVSDFVEYMITKPRKELLYLKDWHLRRILPNDAFYSVHRLFGSDWLNEYSIDTNKDDYMFVYIGPKDSWTPLHADVFNSYSWSVNVTGRKKWLFFPPGEELKLKDSLQNLPLMYDPTKHNKVKYFEITQEKGDAIFVPSGWHHQVVNQVDTISVNHNWVNGCNIALVWEALNESLGKVKNEIEEFKDTPEFFDDCQVMLKLYFGMNFQDFLDFLVFIAKKRLFELKKNSKKEKYLIFNQFYFGDNHILFDLKNILNVYNLFLNHPDIIAEKMKVDTTIYMLKQEINEILQIYISCKSFILPDKEYNKVVPTNNSYSSNYYISTRTLRKDTQ